MSEEALPLPVAEESEASVIAAEAVAPASLESAAPAPVTKPKRKLATPKAKVEVAAAVPVRAVKATASIARPKPVAKAKPIATPVAPPAIKVKAVRSKPIPSKTKPVAPKAKPVIRAKSLSEIFPMTTDFTAKIKTALADVQGKAKAAYAKGSASLAEGTEFAKGNVEAVVESGKILGEGLQKLGTELVAESKGTFETLTAEAKELAAVKTPTDYFKLQSELLRKHFDSAVAFSSKQTEAMVRLSTESMAPISRRVTLAMEAIKKAA